MDCTYSMQPWIDETKKNVIKIVNDTKAKFKKNIKVGFLGYRDTVDEK